MVWSARRRRRSGFELSQQAEGCGPIGDSVSRDFSIKGRQATAVGDGQRQEVDVSHVAGTEKTAANQMLLISQTYGVRPEYMTRQGAKGLKRWQYS